jgi:hypothetical protein
MPAADIYFKALLIVDTHSPALADRFLPSLDDYTLSA